LQFVSKLVSNVSASPGILYNERAEVVKRLSAPGEIARGTQLCDADSRDCYFRFGSRLNVIKIGQIVIVAFGDTFVNLTRGDSTRVPGERLFSELLSRNVWFLPRKSRIVPGMTILFYQNSKGVE